jgi:predicted acetyltransferase
MKLPRQCCNALFLSEKSNFLVNAAQDNHLFDMMTKAPFSFLRPGRLVDGDLELVLVHTVPADPVKRYVPGYEFEMRRPGKAVGMGLLRLRIGSALRLRYPGHIGYEVKRRFRGHRYAARSCRLVLSLARAHGLKALWLTVDPKNIASQRTCEILGAQWVETVRIPKTHEMYTKGARHRRRYRVDLKKISNRVAGGD